MNILSRNSLKGRWKGQLDKMPKAADKNITLSLNPQEYEQLMKWALAGQSVYYTYHHPGKAKIDQVNEFFQGLFEQGKNIKGLFQDERIVILTSLADWSSA